MRPELKETPPARKAAMVCVPRIGAIKVGCPL